MKDILRRTLRWHWHRRDRRIARLGGHPYGDGPPPVERFAPDLEEAARVKLVQGYAGLLTPEGVDEGTPHALDNLINALIDVWISEMRMRYAEFLSKAAFRRGQANGVIEQYRTLHEHDLHRLQRMDMALESAMYRLCGDGPATALEGDDDDDR
jgi:hypothetical protein